MEPTDRSTLRVTMTTIWPIASSSRIEGVSRVSRQPSPLKTNVGRRMVAARMIRTSTIAIENSRERTHAS